MSLDGIYSISLLISWIAAGLGIIILSAAVFSRKVQVSERLAVVCWVVPVFFLGISMVTHVFGGHRPGTPNALSPLAFLGAHPGFLIAAALAVGCYLLSSKHRG
jgi:hypothetical protein